MNSALFNDLLEYYGIDESTYLELTRKVDSNSFAAGHHFDNEKEAAMLVKEVIANKGKIFIYGDYDADGIMGTSILVKMFKYLNYDVESYIPNRYLDGYGLTLEKAKEWAEKGASLVITVDNGVSCVEQIKYLKDKGIKVLVLDHHQVQENVPNADYILHPTYSHFGETASSGAFVAFNFSRVVLGRFDKYLSILASISLISDMMPLKDYNRDLLRIVINNYIDGEFETIDALKEGERFDETSIGMKIAPKINAIGRMIETSEINKMVSYFTSENHQESLTYLEWITETNEQRKSLSKEAIDQLVDFDENLPAIVYVTNLKEGLLGLVSNFLIGKYKKPAIVLCLDNDGTCYKGSCRAPEGFNIVQCFEALSKYLVAYGGHASAGGCSVLKDKIEEFKKDFNEYAKNTVITSQEKRTINLSIVDLNFETLNLVNSFSPFGEEWESPVFKIRRIDTKNLFFSKNLEHIVTSLGFSSKLTGFHMPRDEVTKFKYIDIYGSIRISSYKGRNSVEFLIDEYKEAQ